LEYSSCYSKEVERKQTGGFIALFIRFRNKTLPVQTQIGCS
jgi:hypothetical protein